MAVDSSQLKLIKPVSVLKKELTFDAKSFFVHGSKAAIKLATLNLDGAAVSASDFINDVGLKQKPQEIAWLLIYQAMMSNIANIVHDSRDLFSPAPTEAQKAGLGKALEQLLTTKPYYIDSNFFNRPQQADFVTDFLPPFATWLQQFDLNQAAATMVGHRLKANFALALNNEWAKNSELYTVLKQNLTTPFSTATENQQQWRNYNLWLQSQVNQRMYGEAFSLVDLYIKPYATYTIEADSADEHDEEDQEYEVELHEELTEWAQDYNSNDVYRVISGPPGAGKSSIAKMLAVEWGKNLGFPVLFIPLHHFNLTTSLVDAVGKFIANNRYLSANPLEVGNGEDRMILIFDGLDELAEQGKNAIELAKNFVAMLVKEIDLHNTQDCQRQVLLTGRDLSINSIMPNFHKPEQIYHLQPFDSEQLNQWWQKYGAASGLGYQQMPEALTIEQLQEVITQPLLSYLIALSYVRGKITFDESTSLNQIYQDLLESVYERERDKKITNVAAELTQDKFIRIFEEIALAVWHGDGRTTTVAAIEKQCQSSNLLQSLSAFQHSAEDGVTRLLTAFYFRSSGENKQGDRTFEFTHKSFGEYLTAKRLVRLIDIICRQRETNIESPDIGWSKKEALIKWITFTGPTAIDEYLLPFIRNEIKLKGKAICQQWQQHLNDLLNHSINHSLPMEEMHGLNFAQMTTQARNSDEALLVCLNACALVTKQLSVVNVRKPTNFGDWFKRLQKQRDEWESCVAYNCLSYLDLSHLELRRQDFVYSNLSSTKLANSYLNSSDLTDAYLIDADLTDADLTGADLTGAELTGADLTGADLTGADLIRANLTLVNLTDANLTDANLTDANLTDANLTDPDLTDADLTDADLTDADLTGVKINFARHSESIFSEQQLKQIIVDE